MTDAILDAVDAVTFAPLTWLAMQVVVAGGPVWPLRCVSVAGMRWRRAFRWLTFSQGGS